MSLGDFLVGALWLTTGVGFVLLAAGIVVRGRLAHLPAAAAVTAWGVLGTVGVLGIHVLPMALGVLSSPAVSVVATAVLVAAWRWGRSPRRDGLSREATRGLDSPRSWWVVAALAAGAVWAYAAAFAAAKVVVPLEAIDALSFHLPGVARWIETGSLWQIDSFVPRWAFGNYPNTGNVMQLAVVLPWSNDALARFAMYPFLGLAGVGAYAAACELRAPRAAAVVAAALVCAMPAVSLSALDQGQVDVLTLSGLAAAVLFLLRHRRTGARSDLLLAGLGLGIVLGAKWYGVTTVAVVGAVWAVSAGLARRPVRQVARDGGLLVGVTAVTGGIWMLRNLLLSGNPVFPVKVSLLGVTIFDAPRDPIREEAGFSITDYAGEPDVWGQIAHELLRSFGFAGPALALAAALAGILAARAWRGGERDAAAAFAVAVAAVVLVVVYANTPYTAYGPKGDPLLTAASARYAGPALLVSAIAAAWLAGRLGRGGLLAALGGAVLVAEALSRNGEFFDTRFAPLRPRSVAVALAALAFVAAVVVLARRLERRRARGPVPRGPLLAGAALAVVVLLAAGHLQQKAFNDGRYAGANPVYDWLQTNAPEGRRVGLAGQWLNTQVAPPWVAFGPRLGNQVEYVGTWRRERLERYERQGDFACALARGRYDLLLVGTVVYPKQPNADVAWAKAAGYRVVASGGTLVLLRPPEGSPAQDARQCAAERS